METDNQKPVPHREGIALLAYNELKRKHYIICKLAHSPKAQLIRIDPESGVLKWDQAVGRDTFENEAAALAYLQDQGKVEVLAHGKAVLGYVVMGPVALLLMAEAVRFSAALPGGHEIKTVTQSKWHRINLQQPELDVTTQAATKAELDRGIDKTTNFPMDGAHYYCETLDITRPFPSERPACQPSWPFVWNKALSAPFRAAGLDGPHTVCPALLQGMAESRDLEDFDGCPFSYALISRRCRLHVGPRYKARGLNEAADPGNEIECDQVVWKHSTSPQKPLAWSRYTWRRGSVPMWWTVNIRNGGMGEAEIKIRTTNTFRGSRRYVRRLQRRYVASPHLDPDDELQVQGQGRQDASVQVPVVFFSLLRKGTPDRDRSEAKLAEAFDFLAGQLRSVHKLPVNYVALDWHQLDKELGSEALVEAFWTQLSALLPPQGFALGTMSKVGPDHTDSDGLELGAAAAAESAAVVAAAQPAAAGERGYSTAGRGWVARWFKQQRGVTRYNCADSLDRTNVGSFFGAVQVFVEQCRELDIAIAATSSGAANIARQSLLRRQAAAAAAAAAAAGAAGGSGGGAAAAVGGGGRPPLGSPSGLSQDKKGSSGSGSSGFLSSLSKDLTRGLNTVMGDRRASPRAGGSALPSTASPDASPRDLHRDLRTHSTPNLSMMQQRGGGGSAAELRMQLLQPQQQLQQQQQVGAASAAAAAAAGSDLPPGWEAKYDGVNKRVFYVDHNTKTTTWNKPVWPPPSPVQVPAAAGSTAAAPTADVAAAVASNGSSNGLTEAAAATSSSSSGGMEQQLVSVAAASSSSSSSSIRPGGSPLHSRPGSSHHSRRSLQPDDASGSDSDSGADKERYEPLTPWCMFSPRHAKVRHFARRINPAALSAIAELFLMNGDMCAWLYTGSPAMHSEKITMFEPESSRLKKAGAGTYSNSFIAIRRRYNNVLMDEERKMQAEIFLGLKSRLYFPTLHLQYREPEAVPDDWPESDDDDPANPDAADPLGMLTWPLESSKARIGGSIAGAAAALVGLAGSGSSLVPMMGRSESRERGAGALNDGSAELFVERVASHTRSFSSEKIFQDFRELHRVSQGTSSAVGAAGAGAGAGVTGLQPPSGPSKPDSVLAAGRPPPSPSGGSSSFGSGAISSNRPTPTEAATKAVTAATDLGSNSLADFDEELSDKAPPAAAAVNVLKPFEDPLGLL